MTTEESLGMMHKPTATPINIVRPVNNQNANEMYICENGHLQYNLTNDDKAELLERGMPIPPVVFNGAKCGNCDLYVTSLTNDVLHLQQKLATQMQIVTMLRANMAGFQDANEDQNVIAMFIRQNYGHEISIGLPQHSGRASLAVVYYLQRERRRVSVRLARFGRWVLQMVGAA
jgi:hypothetical protein